MKTSHIRIECISEKTPRPLVVMTFTRNAGCIARNIIGKETEADAAIMLIELVERELRTLKELYIASQN